MLTEKQEAKLHSLTYPTFVDWLQKHAFLFTLNEKCKLSDLHLSYQKYYKRETRIQVSHPPTSVSNIECFFKYLKKLGGIKSWDIERVQVDKDVYVTFKSAWKRWKRKTLEKKEKNLVIKTTEPKIDETPFNILECNSLIINEGIINIGEYTIKGTFTLTKN